MAINDDLIYEADENGQMVVVKSLESSHAAYLRFTNKTSRRVDVWWRDFNGEKQHYIRLEPGAHYDVNSFITHPWEFTDSATKEQYVINNKAVFRAPRNHGNVRYRMNWNITIAVRTLRHTAMLSIATALPEPLAATQLELPRALAQELQELVTVLKTVRAITNNH